MQAQGTAPALSRSEFAVIDRLMRDNLTPGSTREKQPPADPERRHDGQTRLRR